MSEARSYQTIADFLILDKAGAAFVEACAEHNILNMLGSMYYKKDADKRIPFTVFVPKKLTLPKNKDEAFRLLRCHIVKNKFDEDSIVKMCDAHAANGLEKLTLPSMGGVSYEVSCSDNKNLILPDGKSVELSGGKLFKNGSIYIIKETLPIKFADTESMVSKEQVPSIIDVLYNNTDTRPFVEACCKYNLVSLLCNKYYDKNRNSHSMYTVFAPKKLSLKGKSEIEAQHILRSHIIKRPFDMENIKKFCSMHASNGIVELTLGTMTSTKHQISCETMKLKTSKDEIDLVDSQKVKNGIVYIIDKSLDVDPNVPTSFGKKEEEEITVGGGKKKKAATKTSKVKKAVETPELILV